MTFGFTNAPATFQRLMTYIFDPYTNQFIIVYLNDILIFSRTKADHLQHLRWTFDQLRNNQLYAKLTKCEFFKESVAYLGHIISENQIRIDPAKIAAVIEWPIPANLKDIQAFFELANYYCRFIYRFSHIAQPLTELTKKDNFLWSVPTQTAFNTLKTAITTASILRIFDPTLET